MALDAYALDRARRRGARASKWDRERGRKLGLHTCANPRRRVGARKQHGDHALGIFCPDILPLPVCFEWSDGDGERRDGIRKDIDVVGKIRGHNKTT
jgi:hypothetical protein